MKALSKFLERVSPAPFKHVYLFSYSAGDGGLGHAHINMKHPYTPRDTITVMEFIRDTNGLSDTPAIMGVYYFGYIRSTTKPQVGG